MKRGEIVASRKARYLAYVIAAFGLGMSQIWGLLIPLRARELGASFEIIGIIVAAYSVAPVLLSIPLGGIIDRFGSRKSFILGAALSGAVGVAAVLVHDYWLLLGLQFVFGTTRGLGWIASQSYVTSLGGPEERAALTGRFSFFSNIGPMVGPLGAGAFAQVVGFQYAFFFVTFYGLAFCLLGIFLTKTPGSGGDRVRRGRDVGFGVALKLLAVRGVQIALILTAVRLWVTRAWTAFFPVYLVDLGMEAGAVGAVVAVAGLVATLVAPSAGLLCRLASPPVVATTGLALGALGLTISSQLTSVPLIYLAPILVGVGTGLSLPLLLTIISGAAAEDRRGVALGLRQVANNVASGIAPLVFGPLVTIAGITFAFASSGGVAFMALAIASILNLGARRTASKPNDAEARVT